MFDILRPRIMGAVFLDLFAGTGNVSMEALSRGALKTVSAEKEIACLKAIKRNAEHLGFSDRATILKADLLKPIAWLKAYAEGDGYDIIFMGPPYRDIKNTPLFFTEPVLKQIAEAKLLASNGLIVAQHHKKETFALPENLQIVREEKYGDTTVHFLKYK